MATRARSRAGSSGGPSTARAVAGVIRRPRLWTTALREAHLLARPGWWRRWPPVPLPEDHYLRFRLLTAYGDAEAAAPAGDLVAYLEWCRRMQALRG